MTQLKFSTATGSLNSGQSYMQLVTPLLFYFNRPTMFNFYRQSLNKILKMTQQYKYMKQNEKIKGQSVGFPRLILLNKLKIKGNQFKFVQVRFHWALSSSTQALQGQGSSMGYKKKNKPSFFLITFKNKQDYQCSTSTLSERTHQPF